MPGFRPIPPWPELPPERLCPQVQMAGFYIFRPPMAPRYRVQGLHLCLITEGTIQFAFPHGGTGTAQAGNVVWFGNGINHYEIGSSGPLSFYQLHFNAGRGADANGIPIIPGFGSLPHCFPVGDAMPAFIGAFDRIIQALLQTSPMWQIETASATLDLMRLSFAQVMKRGPTPILRLDPWEKLLARLEDDSFAPRISDLAREFRITPEAFIRKFFQRTGNTPKQYLLQRRLWKARRLLQSGSSSKEAARLCGFADPLYFSRQYRKNFGHPPSRTQEHTDATEPDHNTSLPISRHVFAPGMDIRMFSPDLKT